MLANPAQGLVVVAWWSKICDGGSCYPYLYGYNTDIHCGGKVYSWMKNHCRCKNWAFFSCSRVQASGASRSYKCSEREKKRKEKRERRNEIIMAAPLYYRSLPYSAKCQLIMNVDTVDSPALGDGYGIGRWPAHAR